MERPVSEVVRSCASGSVLVESLGGDPLRQPAHVAVAVDGVRDQVQGAQGAQGVEGACGRIHRIKVVLSLIVVMFTWCYATDFVREEIQGLHVGQPPQDSIVHPRNRILR